MSGAGEELPLAFFEVLCPMPGQDADLLQLLDAAMSAQFGLPGPEAHLVEEDMHVLGVLQAGITSFDPQGLQVRLHIAAHAAQDEPDVALGNALGGATSAAAYSTGKLAVELLPEWCLPRMRC